MTLTYSQVRELSKSRKEAPVVFFGPSDNYHQEATTASPLMARNPHQHPSCMHKQIIATLSVAISPLSVIVSHELSV